METTPKTSATRLGAHTYHIAAAGGALVQFASLPDAATMDVGTLRKVTQGTTSAEIMSWGKDNNLPFYREELITGNNIVPALIERKRNIICGQGWYAYKEKFQDDGSGSMKRVLDEVPMPPGADVFFKKFKKTARQLVGEMLKHSIAMPEFIRGLRGDQKIVSVKSLEMKACRPEKKTDGEILNWYWSNFWQKNSPVKAADKLLRILPCYDETGKKQKRFVLPIFDDLFNDGYFPIPAYWGGRHWITLSNIIPLFHEANLKHGQLPRWNVIIPHDYFYDYEKMEAATTDEERTNLLKEFAQNEQDFIDDFNTVMTGIGNTGRTIITKSEIIEALGGKYEKRILIEPLTVDMKDEALLKLFEASNVANVSAQALHPNLASIDSGGKGIGSGTEIRNAFLLYLIIAAPALRDALQEIIEVVKAENGWPVDIHYAIRDAEMTTLAENPAGVQNAETPIGK